MGGAFQMVWAKPEIWITILMGLFLFVLAMRDKLPTTKSFSEFLSALNTKGGNIFVLASFTFYFFIMGIRFIYYALSLLQNPTGKITTDNAILMLAVNTVLTGGFSGCLSVLFKTMDGSALSPPGTSSSTTTTKVEVKPEVKTEGASNV